MNVLNERYNSEARARKTADELKETNIKDYILHTQNEGEAPQLVARRIEKLVPLLPTNNNVDKDENNYNMPYGNKHVNYQS